MYSILEKRVLNAQVELIKVQAPRVAKKCEPGQYIILRVNENGERIPLTIADFDRDEGSITVIYQVVGRTTLLLSRLRKGDCLHDFVGPLGKASRLEGYKRVVVIGGGLGSAIAYPQARKLHQLGAKVDVITGFRNKGMTILEKEMRAVSNKLYVMTDDGSNGNKGFVTQKLEELLQAGNEYDLALAIGPMIMMKATCELTKKYKLKTIVSMNTIMIDGTGMCGGCRLTVNGETKFACVDGPEFDGHQVDFDEAMRRADAYKDFERHAHEEACNLFKEVS